MGMSKWKLPATAKRWMGVLLLIAALGTAAQAAPPEPFIDAATSTRVDDMVRKAIAKNKLPGGFVVLVVRDGKAVLTRAYGYADNEANRPMTVDAVFPLGSITKTFTGTMAVKLAARRIVDLDAPIQTYLPVSVTLNPSVAAVPVTLTTLLTHRTGWPKDQVTRRELKLDLPGGFDPTIADPDSYTVDRFYRGLAETPAEGEPGRFNYSNMGVHLAAHALERAYGKRYPAMLADLVTGPLGMTDTVIDRTPAMAARVPSGYAHDDAGNTYRKVPAWRAGEIVGAAFLNSTAADMARYMALFMDRGATARFLGGDEWDDALFKPYGEVTAGEALRAQGLGWRSGIFGGYGLILRHNGDSDGHNAFMAISRAHSVGVLILTNSNYDINEELGNQTLLLMLQRDRDLRGGDMIAEWRR